MTTQREQRAGVSDRDVEDLERIHRQLFTHPRVEEWRAIRSLAQPSLLMPIKSFTSENTNSVAIPADASEEG